MAGDEQLVRVTTVAADIVAHPADTGIHIGKATVEIDRGHQPMADRRQDDAGRVERRRHEGGILLIAVAPASAMHVGENLSVRLFRHEQGNMLVDVVAIGDIGAVDTVTQADDDVMIRRGCRCARRLWRVVLDTHQRHGQLLRSTDSMSEAVKRGHQQRSSAHVGETAA